MKKSAITAAAFGALVAGAMSLSATALGIPLTGGPADAAVSSLESQGYEVRINQTVNVPIAQCTVIGVSGLRGAEENGVLKNPGALNVAFLDVNCPSHS